MVGACGVDVWAVVLADWGIGVGGAVGAFAVVVPDVERCAVKAYFSG